MKILLVLDFTAANFPNTLRTLLEWCPRLRNCQGHEITVAVTTFKRRTESLVPTSSHTFQWAAGVLKEACGGLPVVFWDEEIDDGVTERVGRIAGIQSQPVYAGTNFGSIVNKGLLLASAYSCGYLIRIDPGTLPPNCDLGSVLDKHLRFIQSADEGEVRVASGRYENRLAIRDFFVKPGEVVNHHWLVGRTTRLNLYSQVTGGALFTSIVPGIPAIPFTRSGNELTLVWASDDGFYQRIRQTAGSQPVKGTVIPRFDPVGQPHSSIAYYRSLAGAVYLFARCDRLDDDSARAEARTFIQDLVQYLDTDKCPQRDFTSPNIVPTSFLDRIADGWNNYTRLSKDWTTMVGNAALQEYLRSSTEI
jgi:hypothetical protein